MPVDPDGQLDARFGRLRADVDATPWADAGAIRRRGDRRTRNHAIGGAAATLVLLGGAGFGFFGTQSLGGDDELAGVPEETPTVTTTQAEPTEPASPTTEDETAPTSEPTEPADEPDSTPPSDDEPTDDGDEPTEPTPGSASPDDTPTEESESPDPTASTLGLQSPAEALLEAAEMFPVNDSATWAGTGTGGETGEVSACVPLTLAGAGATSAAERTYSWGEQVPASNAVGIFSSEADATTAHDTIADAVNGCSWGSPNAPNEVELGADAGEYDSAQWWFIGGSADEGDGEFEVVGLIQRDATVSLVAMYQEGMDYNADPTPTLLAAWEQLEP